MGAPPELARLLDDVTAPDIEERWAVFVQAHSRLLLHTARSVADDRDSAMDAYVYVAPRIARLIGYPTAFRVHRHLNAVLGRLRKQLQDKGIDGPAS